MLSSGPAKKVIIHLNDDVSSRHDFLHNEIFSFLFNHGVSGASLIRPEAGFGVHHRMHSSGGSAWAAEHLPILIEFIESSEKLDEIMPALCELITDGLVEVHDTTVLKVVSKPTDDVV